MRNTRGIHLPYEVLQCARAMHLAVQDMRCHAREGNACTVPQVELQFCSSLLQIEGLPVQESQSPCISRKIDIYFADVGELAEAVMHTSPACCTSRASMQSSMDHSQCYKTVINSNDAGAFLSWGLAMVFHSAVH